MDKTYVGIVSLENTNDGIMARHRINKYLDIPHHKINIFKNKKIDNQNYIYKAHDLIGNHLKIIKKAHDLNYQYALIFEDDVEFMEYNDREIKDIFNQALEDLKDLDIELLNFGSSLTPILKIKNNIFISEHTNHAHMYIVTRKGMKKILSLHYPVKFTQDYFGINNFMSFSQYDIRYFSLLNTAIVSPPISYQRKMPNIFKKINILNDHQKILDFNLDFYQKYVYFLSIIILLLGLLDKRIILLFLFMVFIYKSGLIVSKIVYMILDFYKVY